MMFIVLCSCMTVHATAAALYVVDLNFKLKGFGENDKEENSNCKYIAGLHM